MFQNYKCVHTLVDDAGIVNFTEGRVYQGYFDDDGYFCAIGNNHETYAFVDSEYFCLVKGE